MDIVAADAQNTGIRQPCLSRARRLLVAKIGDEEAEKMVLQRPYKILSNQPIETAAVTSSLRKPEEKSLASRLGALGRMFGGS